MERELNALAEAYPNAPWVICRSPWQKQAKVFLAIDDGPQGA
jgi:hypothetical protein